ncbi:MAG: VanW family protein [Armatimonadetes bacterium]|nr:VanW family protein [Candidatus Hippobium faecium]
MKKIFAISGIVIVILCFALWLSVFLTVNSYKNGSNKEIIIGRIYALGVDIGGKSRQDAKELLTRKANEALSKKLTVNINQDKYEIAYKSLGLVYNIDEIIEEAYVFGRNGGLFDNFMNIISDTWFNMSVTPQYNKKLTEEFVSDTAKKYSAKPVNAKIHKSGVGISVSPSRDGMTVDKKLLAEKIEKALFHGEETVDFSVKIVKPKITAESLQSVNKKLGSFSTKYNSGKVQRSHNLAVACRKINESLVMPGETFSFNGTVGPRNARTGFQNAIVFQDGEEVEGMGGGICQVSSTLFNATLLSGLQISQRRCHSLKVAYVPLGRDAMVSYGSSDFRFRNNTSYPVAVFISAGGGTLSAEIWGNSSAYKKCELQRSVSEDGYSATLTRYEIASDGTKKSTYTTSSRYQKPKPKPKENNKPQDIN